MPRNDTPVPSEQVHKDREDEPKIRGTLMEMRVLFVCSRNRQRSLTAERVFAGHPEIQVRSAGTEPAARVRVTAKHLQWADIVFAMEKRHLIRMRQRFAVDVQNLIDDGALIVLDIPDIYQLMDPDLVVLLKQIVPEFLQESDNEL